MHQNWRSLLGIGLFLALLAPAVGAETIDNPAYKAWSDYKVGSSATLAGTMQSGQVSITMETKNTLLELTADHAVVETAVTMTVFGNARTAPTRKTTIPARTEKKDWKELGAEDVQAAGKTYKCKVVEGSNPVGGTGGNSAKVWYSDEVPGGTVQIKVSVPTSGPAASGASATFLLKSIETK